MVSVKSGEIDPFLKRTAALGVSAPSAVFLFYGPDVGLVNERAVFLAKALGDNPSDPFQLIKMDGDLLATDPPRLIDEVNTINLFGSRRVIHIRTGSKNIAPAVSLVLSAEKQEAPVIIEAGDLKNSAPLRILCEKAKNAYACPCYADSEKDIALLFDDMLKKEGLLISREARASALESLGGDRLATRGEIAKLILYARPTNGEQPKEISISDVENVLADVSGLMVDVVIDVAFSGNIRSLEMDTQRLVAEGIHGAVVLGSALRHAFQLLALRHTMENGTSLVKALEGWRGLHFKRKQNVTQHLSRFNSRDLKIIIQNLHTAILETRRQASLTHVLMRRSLMQIAVMRSGKHSSN